MSTIHYKQVLVKEGVTVDVLTDKTKRKVAEYERVFANPIGKNKKTGAFHPATQVKLDDLNSDIIENIYVYLDEQADTTAEQERIEAERLAAEKQAEADKVVAAELAAQEEEARIAAEQAETERLAAEEAAKLVPKLKEEPVKKKSFFEDLFSW